MSQVSPQRLAETNKAKRTWMQNISMMHKKATFCFTFCKLWQRIHWLLWLRFLPVKADRCLLLYGQCRLTRFWQTQCVWDAAFCSFCMFMLKNTSTHLFAHNLNTGFEDVTQHGFFQQPQKYFRHAEFIVHIFTNRINRWRDKELEKGRRLQEGNRVGMT